MKYVYVFQYRTAGGDVSERRIYNDLKGEAIAYIRLRNWLSRHSPGATRIKLIDAWEAQSE